MAWTLGTRFEIRKFDGKNFALLKEMMQDMLIIRRQIEVIRHNSKMASMIDGKWWSLDEIARSTIRMQLAIRKEVELLQNHLDSAMIHHENEGDKADNLPRQHFQ